jgi:hypothetical protein
MINNNDTFNDTDLFSVGTAPKRYIDLPDLEPLHFEGFITKEEADGCYNPKAAKARPERIIKFFSV